MESNLNTKTEFRIVDLVQVYACIISPAVWLIGVVSSLMFGNSIEEISPLRGTEIGLWISTTLNSLLVTIIIFVGGIRLYAAQSTNALVTITFGIGLSLFLGMTGLISLIAMELTAEEFDHTLSSTVENVNLVLLVLLVNLPDFLLQVFILGYLIFKKTDIVELASRGNRDQVAESEPKKHSKLDDANEHIPQHAGENHE